MTQDEMMEIKVKALHIARDMKPGPIYTGIGHQPTIPFYDILKEAESIYQWIIKTTAK